DFKYGIVETFSMLDVEWENSKMEPSLAPKRIESSLEEMVEIRCDVRSRSMESLKDVYIPGGVIRVSSPLLVANQKSPMESFPKTMSLGSADLPSKMLS